MRQAQLAAIHIAKKDLALDDDLYRQMLKEVTGKESAAKLTAAERTAFLDFLGTKGFKKKPGAKKRSFKKADFAPERKMYAIWNELKEMGALNNPNASLISFLKRMNVTDVDEVKWMDPLQIQKGIEVLKQFQKRQEKKNG